MDGPAKRKRNIRGDPRQIGTTLAYNISQYVRFCLLIGRESTLRVREAHPLTVTTKTPSWKEPADAECLSPVTPKTPVMPCLSPLSGNIEPPLLAAKKGIDAKCTIT